MIKVSIAKHSGFCFGVKRAINIVNELSSDKTKSPVYTLGPIIHNPQTVDKLKEQGIEPLENLNGVKKGTIVLRTHGVERKLMDELKKRKLNMVDATCPFVRRAQDYVRLLDEKGYTPIIIGEKNHPEVLALKSQIDSDVFVIENEEDIKILKKIKSDKVGIVSQTTQSIENLKKMVELLMDYFTEVLVINTICNATSQRQESAVKLAKKVDVMLIVGGKNSGNTQRLYSLCKRITKNTYHIETEKDIKRTMIRGAKTVGIAAGASTPDWIVQNVKDFIKKIDKEEHENVRKL